MFQKFDLNSNSCAAETCMATILMKASAHRQFASLLSLIRSQMHMLRIQNTIPIVSKICTVTPHLVECQIHANVRLYGIRH